MSHQVVKVKREGVAPCMTCPLCLKLLRDATTIIECLHTFCRKCIFKKLSDEEMECCPICNIDLGCVPLEKLRPDHNLQDVRAKIFPHKRIKVRAPEIVLPVVLPAKRKERSLSSLVVSTPRVSPHIAMTGRRSKSTARKASKGSSFTIEKPVKNTVDDNPESSSSPETSNKFAQHSRQQIGSKSSKTGTQGSLAKSEEQQQSYDNEGPLRKKQNKELRKKPKVKDEKNSSDQTTHVESERPKKLRKIRPKAQELGELRVSPQVVLDVGSAKLEKRNYPIWFSLVASEELKGDAPPLPQIPSNYLRIKDGTIPVSFVQKYLKSKLDLTSEVEVDIKCMGQTIIPTLPLNNLVERWLQTTTREKVSATIGSSAKDFVMVLGYARRVPDS